MAPLRRTAALQLAAICALVATPAQAHGFGARYDLPIPLTLYLAGAALAVLVSFIAMVLFSTLFSGTRNGTARQPPRFRCSAVAPPITSRLAYGLIFTLPRCFGVGMLVLIVIAGLFGNQNPLRNIAPAAIWILWWVGVAYVSALVGNVWRTLNPWATVYDLALAPLARLMGSRRRWAYPDRLGRWPAVATLIVFAWAELVWPNKESPSQLATLALAYSVWTWIGMVLFGRTAWLRNAEAFTVLFALFARFAPLRLRADPQTRRWTLLVRAPGTGLITRGPVSVSMTFFVLLILATVTYDGFLETPAWGAIMDAVFGTQALAPLLFGLDHATGNVMAALKTFGLILFPALFTALFFCVMYLSRTAAGNGAPPITAMAGSFVLTLVPIAVAYHLAHYLSFLLIAGQMTIPLASDPMGFGWDLFGTTRYIIDISVTNTRMIWYTAVVAIVLGHIMAVVVSHVMALRLFGDKSIALRSQIPMLGLMIVYTTVSLWILAQPIVSYTPS